MLSPKSYVIAFCRDGVYMILLFLLFTEWRRPLFQLSSETDLYIIEPFLLAVAAFVLIDQFAKNWVWNLCLKLLISLQTVSFFFHLGLPFQAESWAKLLSIWASDVGHAFQGMWFEISAETRTLLFLLGWAILTYAVRAFMLERYRILWFVGLTFIYFFMLEIWGGASISSAYVRVLFIGLLLQALLSLPRIEKLFELVQTRRWWTWKWIAFSVGAVSLIVGAAAYLSFATTEGRDDASWNTFADRFFNDLSFESLAVHPTLQATSHRSGYSEGDRELGGSVELSEQLVFVAKTEKPTYWRGESKAIYTGKGWESSSEAESMPLRPDHAGDAGGALYEGVTVRTIDQTVAFLTKSPSSVIFAGGEIVEIQEIRDHEGEPYPTDRQVVAYQAEGEAWKLSQPQEMTYYNIRVNVPTDDSITTLRAVQDKRFNELTSKYMQLPESLPDRVKLLARRLTAPLEHDWDKALAIQSYLHQHYLYQLDSIGYPGEQQDFVDHFLFQSQQGYCDHFSTALTVMLRASGVPARWVKGFAPGEVSYLEDEQLYQATVRERHAHSWAEVYVKGAGWVPIEATPGFSAAGEPVQMAEGEQLAAAELGEQAADPSWIQMLKVKSKVLYSALASEIKDRYIASAISLHQWVIAAVMFFLILVIFPVIRIMKGQYISFIQNPRDRLLHCFEKVWERMFKLYGPMQPDQTIREYMHALCRKHALREMELMEFARMYENVRYGTFRYPPYREEEIQEKSRKLFRFLDA